MTMLVAVECGEPWAWHVAQKIQWMWPWFSLKSFTSACGCRAVFWENPVTFTGECGATLTAHIYWRIWCHTHWIFSMNVWSASECGVNVAWMWRTGECGATLTGFSQFSLKTALQPHALVNDCRENHGHIHWIFSKVSSAAVWYSKSRGKSSGEQTFWE